MTTTIALSTNSCIVLGCDSLGTISLPLVRTRELFNQLFDGKGNHKLDATGNPVYLTPDMLMSLSRSVPSNQIPAVTKLFSLDKDKKKKIDAAALFAGVAALGEKSLRTIIGEFKESQPFDRWQSQGKISDLAKCLGDHINKEYKAANEDLAMEIILAGYSKNSREPEIFKIKINNGVDPEITEENKSPEKFKVVFGGQYDVIERVVDGIDLQGFGAIVQQTEIALSKYREKLTETLNLKGITEVLPEYKDYGDIGQFFEYPFEFSRLSSEIRYFSEQAAIDFVEFLVELMIKSQQFSNQIPTVGGDIHVGLIIAHEGFRLITKEHYRSKEHSVPKHKED